MRALCLLVCIGLVSYMASMIAINQTLHQFHKDYAVLIIQHKDADYIVHDTDAERAHSDYTKRMEKEVPTEVSK